MAKGEIPIRFGYWVIRSGDNDIELSFDFCCKKIESGVVEPCLVVETCRREFLNFFVGFAGGNFLTVGQNVFYSLP